MSSQEEVKKESVYTEQATKNRDCSQYKKFSDIYNSLDWSPYNIEANQNFIDKLDPNIIDIKIKNEISNSVKTGKQIGDFLDDPFLSSVYNLKAVNDILAGIYVPYSKNENDIREFLLIYRDFFEIFYFEQGYIAYGEDLKKAEDLDDFLDTSKKVKLANRSKFRLYRFLGTESPKGELVKVASALSGQIINVRKNRLIPITFNQGMNRINWLRLWRNYDANKQKFLNMYNTATKCMFVNATNDEQAEKELEQLNNDKTFYITKVDENSGDENEFLPTKFTSQDEARKCFQNNEMYFEVEAARYGFPGKGINNKEERLTQNESYQSMKAIKGMQEAILRELNNIAYFMKKQFPKGALPEDFKFVIKGEEENKWFNKPYFFNKPFGGAFKDEHNFGKGKLEETVPKPPKPGT